MAIRSLLETVASQHLIQRRRYTNEAQLAKNDEFSQMLFANLQAMRRALEKKQDS